MRSAPLAVVLAALLAAPPALAREPAVPPPPTGANGAPLPDQRRQTVPDRVPARPPPGFGNTPADEETPHPERAPARDGTDCLHTARMIIDRRRDVRTACSVSDPSCASLALDLKVQEDRFHAAGCGELPTEARGDVGERQAAADLCSAEAGRVDGARRAEGEGSGNWGAGGFFAGLGCGLPGCLVVGVASELHTPRAPMPPQCLSSPGYALAFDRSYGDTKAAADSSLAWGLGALGAGISALAIGIYYAHDHGKL